MYKLSLFLGFSIFSLWSLFGPFSSLNYYGDALILMENLEIIASHGGFFSMYSFTILGFLSNESIFHLVSVPLLSVTDNSSVVMNIFSSLIVLIWLLIGFRLRANITLFLIIFCPLYLISARSTIPFTLCWSLIYFLFTYLRSVPVRSAFLLSPFCLLHWSSFVPIAILFFYNKIYSLFVRVRFIFSGKNFGFSKIIPFVLIVFSILLAALNIPIYSSLKFSLIYPCALAILFLAKPSYSNIFDFVCLVLFLLSSLISPWAYRFLFFCPFVLYNLISSCKPNVRVFLYTFLVVYSLLFYSIWSPLDAYPVG